jgi:hypothetical protein
LRRSIGRWSPPCQKAQDVLSEEIASIEWVSLLLKAPTGGGA